MEGYILGEFSESEVTKFVQAHQVRFCLTYNPRIQREVEVCLFQDKTNRRALNAQLIDALFSHRRENCSSAFRSGL